MNYRRLSSLITDPMFWSADGNLARLLSHIFASEEGIAVIRPWTADGWLSGDQARRWLEDTKPIWSTTGLDSEKIYGRLWDGRCVLFMDFKRFANRTLASNLQKDSREALEAFFSDQRLAATCISLAVDWSVPRDGTIMWTPQFRIYDHWPRSRNIAPAQDADGTGPVVRSYDPGTAAEILYDKHFSLGYFQAWRWLRYSFDLGSSSIKTSEASYFPPVFFFAEPDNDSGVWPTPDEMLGSGNWPDLTKLIGPILDTPDPLDDEITGALVDGRFIVLHRDREDASGDNGSNRVFPMYLAVVWKGLDDDGVLIEERSAWVADQLSYLWQMSTLFVRDWLGRSEVIELKLRNVSDGLVRPSQDLLRRLRLALDFQYLMTKGNAFKAVQRLRSIGSRTGLFFVDQVYEKMVLSDQSKREQERAQRRARGLFRVRRLVTMRPLLEATGTSGIQVDAQTKLDELTATIDRVREWSAELEKTTSQIHAQEATELQGKSERHNRDLTVALAFLAAVVALPLVIGDLSWQDLLTAVGAHPIPPFVSTSLSASHPYLTVFAVGAAALAVSGLLAYLCFNLVQSYLPNRLMWQARFGANVSRLWDDIDSVSRTARRGGAVDDKLEDLSLAGRLAAIFDELTRDLARLRGNGKRDLELSDEVGMLEIKLEVIAFRRKSGARSLPLYLLLLERQCEIVLNLQVLERDELLLDLGRFEDPAAALNVIVTEAGKRSEFSATQFVKEMSSFVYAGSDAELRELSNRGSST